MTNSKNFLSAMVEIRGVDACQLGMLKTRHIALRQAGIFGKILIKPLIKTFIRCCDQPRVATPVHG